MFHKRGGCSTKEVGVPQKRWVFHKRGGCSTKEVGVPQKRWVFHKRGGCSTKEVGVPQKRWVFYKRGGCSTKEVGVPQKRWVFHKRGGCSTKEVGVPQKDRTEIWKAIFGEEGLVNADDSISFDKMSKYPKFTKYFNRKLKPCLQFYVNQPSRASKISEWTNNNCESLNNIMKSDANRKMKSTPELIDMLHEITVFHVKDFRRTLYGEGN